MILLISFKELVFSQNSSKTRYQNEPNDRVSIFEQKKKRTRAFV